MRLFAFLFFITFSGNVHSQWETTWFPSDLNIQPFTSNILEARNGFMFAIAEKKLRLNIGTSKDILHHNIKKKSFSVGADLFTYTRLRSEGNFKFPVETIDYFFGLNCGYKILVRESEFGLRFRISHISTHLVDGNFDTTNKIWKGGREPFIYSREFLEFGPYYKFSSIRIYSVLTYNFHTIPENISNGMFQIGFDYYYKNIFQNLFYPFIAYDFKLTGINSIYSSTHLLKAGLKFGDPIQRGLTILVSYITGKSIHGMLYDTNENYFNLGFKLDI